MFFFVIFIELFLFSSCFLSYLLALVWWEERLFFLLLSLLPYLQIVKQIMELMLVRLQGASSGCPPVVSWPVYTAAMCWWDDRTAFVWRGISKTIPANPALAELELNFSGSGPRLFVIFSMCPNLICTNIIKRPQDIRAEELYTHKQDYRLFCKYGDLFDVWSQLLCADIPGL